MLLGTARIVRWAVEPGVLVMPFDEGRRGAQLLVLQSGALTASHAPEGLAPGSLLLFGGSTTHELEALTLSRLLSLTVPEDVLHGVVEPRSGAPLLLTRSTMLTRGVIAFLSAVAEAPDSEVSSVDRYSLERFMQEMVMALVLDRARALQEPRRRDVFAEAQGIVLARSADPLLDVGMVAAGCNVSVRTVERVYRRNGTTVRGEIRRARVAYAASLLRDPAYDPLGVDEIAQHSGFSNGSSLARAMRAEGCGAPARMRRERHAVSPQG